MADDATIIHGGWLVTNWDQPGSGSVLENGALLSRNGLIAEVGTYQALCARHPDARHVGDASYLVVPGLVNAHSHGRGFSTYQMGQPDEPLEMRIIEMAFRAEWGAADTTAPKKANRGYDPYLDTLWSCLKQLASGITTTVHSHIYVDGPVEQYADLTREVLRGYRDSGIRCAFALGVRDRYTYTFLDDETFLASVPESLRNSPNLRNIQVEMNFDDYLSLLETLAGEFPEIEFQLSPWNPVFCSDRQMEQIVEASRRDGRRVHTHLMETRYQAEFAQRTYGMSWVARLAEIGMLSERFSAAHGIWMDRADMALIKESGAQIVHNPSSNMRLSSGLAPLRQMLELGIPVAIGLDSLSMNDDDDMYQDLRLGQQLQSRPGFGNPHIPAHTMLGMATRNGATVSGFDGIGSIAEGNRADVALLSLPEITCGVANQPLSDLLLHRAKAAHVKSVVVAGKVLLEHGQFSGHDPQAVMRELAEAVSGSGARQSSPVVPEFKRLVREHLEAAEEANGTNPATG